MTSPAIRMVAATLALAGLAYAAAQVGVSQYRYQHSIAYSAQQLARERAEYDRCAADLRRSAAHANLLDLMIDAKCPVRHSTEQFRRSVTLARAQRDRALRNAPTIIGLGALPWALSCLGRIKRRPGADTLAR